MPYPVPPDAASVTRPRLGAAVCLAALLTASPALARSEPPSPEKLTALRLDWLTQLARRDAAEWETSLGTISPQKGLSVGNYQDPTKVLAELGLALKEDYDAVRRALPRLEEKARARREQAQKDWSDVVRRRGAFRAYAERQQAAHGFDFEAGTQAWFKPEPADGVLPAWAAVALLVALKVRRKELRVERRRAQRVAAATVLGAFLALPGCAGPGGSDSPSWATREEAELTAALADATAKASAAEQAATASGGATAAAWANLVAAPREAGKFEVERVVREGESDLRTRLRGVVTDAQLADRLTRDAAEQRAKLSEEQAKLDALVGAAKARNVVGLVARVVAAGLLFGLSVAPLVSARRSRRRRVELASRTCPRCFRLDSLKAEAPRGASARGRKKAPEPEESDGGGEVRCARCGLRIRKSYLAVPRLCFPTVGVRSSGKTHMLVTAYDRIRKRTAPSVATLQPAPTGGDADRRFEQMADEILHRRGVAGATDLVLPDPILVHLKDADPVEPSAALVNLFDYSGELINRDVDVNMLKATAVRMDGFMLFLDPTQLYGNGANVTIDQQLAMLDQFLSHMRKERGVPVGEVIPVPVAVCLPKFDLLIEENPIGGQSVQYIRELVESLNPPPKEVTLAVLRDRSELVEQMLPLMFPGVDVRNVVEGYFGKQLLFFPMSSVSLAERELGEKDLARRRMAPFGVAEPIMWLLHMHGYHVFSG